MLDFEDSTVTYTAVSSPFADLPNIGSPGVDGPPAIPEDPYAYVVAAFQAPPSPDYVMGPEYPPSPKFIPKPVYPEFMPPEDEVLPAEEQPLPATASPTADSQAMFLSRILMRIQRRMIMRTLRRILLIILSTEETMAMMRMSHPMMTRMYSDDWEVAEVVDVGCWGDLVVAGGGGGDTCS
ncbi:hypothetical protein Tco_1153930 [Tanacetum coccineum]